MYFRIIIFSIKYIFVVFTVSSFAAHLGTVGRVYPVEEPDALAEIREAAAQVDWNKAMGREKIIGEI